MKPKGHSQFGQRVTFPDPRNADVDGLVAAGGNFSAPVLLAAYTSGIFPWPSDDYPYLWYSPDPRTVLEPSGLHISRSLRKTLRRQAQRGPWHLTFDHAFRRVVDACATIRRRHEAGTWIDRELRNGFVELHRLGMAHSVEVWHDSDLIGGLYGLAVGSMFCGESMFSRRSEASKVALVALIAKTRQLGIDLIDCQIHTDHLASMGAYQITRNEYLNRLEKAVERPTGVGSWG